MAYGYEPALDSGELRSVVGAALELIVPTRCCPTLECEDGELIDTGEDCRACTERKAQRRADRLTGKTSAATGKHGAAAAECRDCGHPFPGAVPEDSLCKPCREAPAAAVAVLAARFEQDAAGRRAAEELEQEAQRRRATCRAVQVAPVVGGRRPRAGGRGSGGGRSPVRGTAGRQPVDGRLRPAAWDSLTGAGTALIS